MEYGAGDFIEGIPSISILKLRLSAGQTGNQEIGNYVTQAYLSSTNVALGESVFTGLYPSSMANPDLNWYTNIAWSANKNVIEKLIFNRKVRKESAKRAKLKYRYHILCDLCEILCELYGYWI
jgi:hypothetical protein